mgnify:CR=1 FL=1
MKSVNTVVIPEYSEQLVLESIRRARENLQAKENAEKATALDFYYNRNLDTHLEQWFPGESLSQVPMFPMRLVPRFARARMLLLKNEIKRYIGGEESEDYRMMTHHLNSKMREFGEIAWLLGGCHLRSKWNERRQRVEYDILPFVKEYYVQGESEPFAYTYEIEKIGHRRQFVFWSESRDGEKGLHFLYDQAGKVINIPGGDGTNPYDILPISRLFNQGDASDVTRAAVHAGIAMTEIALGVRFSLGQPVISGVHEAQSQIRSGIDRAIILPEGASFNYVSPTGSIPAMIESIALAIQDVENLESRQSDIPMWREWEASRYEIDRKIIEVHTGKNLSEDYSVDFGEVNYPLSEKEQLEVLKIKKEMGIIDQEDIIRHFNPDISDEELAEKLEKENEQNAATAQPAFEGLRRLGTVGV